MSKERGYSQTSVAVKLNYSAVNVSVSKALSEKAQFQV